MFTCKDCKKLLNEQLQIGKRNWCRFCYNKYCRELQRKKYPFRKEKEKKRKREYYLKNISKFRQWTKNYRKTETGKQKIAEARKKIYYEVFVNTPEMKLINLCRVRLREFLKLKNKKKIYKFSEYIGCTSEQLKIHLEKQFKPGMTWENHGEWHIDHIIPLNSAKSEEEIYKLCHYTNLQPLWAKENLSKSDKLIQINI